ncbi:MAG: oligoendopeptidase F [Bacteriovoracaceae bacterium]|jgi:oligoendopeptidase F
MEQITDCTTWDNSNVYSSIDDPKIEEALAWVSKSSLQLKEPAELIASSLQDLDSKAKALIPTAQKLMLDHHAISIEIYTLRTFASCLTSTDAKNEKARALLSRISKVNTELNQITTPLFVFTDKISEEDLELFLDHKEAKDWDFQLKHGRLLSEYSLNNSEEQIISGLSVDGLHAWGNLYNSISGKLTCKVDGEELGLARASSLLRQGDRDKRIKAHKAIKEAWSVHEESSASILNAINGWRLENNSLRSKGASKELHYLDTACHQSHISRKTLDTLMETTFENRSIGHRAHKAMAKGMGVEKLGPWDILAPAPMGKGKGKTYGFKESIDLISEAFSRLTPQMGEFAQMMYKNNWIDAKETEFRSPGAYCTGFAKYREPRVFMTFDGSIGNVITLAHEIGHAYHNWVMRDMPFVKTFYAMTTAETASIFGETLVRDYLFENCKTEEDRFEITWQDAESAGAMLCNIPARFEFEKQLVEKRKESVVPASELKTMMGEAWNTWYGDSISETDEMYWASKLHFSISSIGFYNYPYLFGYLFSLGIYAEKDNHGDKFNDLYTNILRDTGSMNAVDLIKKHLGKSIEEKAFWQGSLDLVNKSVTRFEGLA